MKKQENYLTYIPMISPLNRWEQEGGRVTIHMTHRGVFAAIAQRFFHRPRVSRINLDQLGSFVFPLLDGQRTVQDIAHLVHEKFGAQAEPLYPRLIQYLKILRNNGFIYYVGKDRIPNTKRASGKE